MLGRRRFHVQRVDEAAVAGDDGGPLHFQGGGEKAVVGRERLGQKREGPNALVPFERPAALGELIIDGNYKTIDASCLSRSRFDSPDRKGLLDEQLHI